MICETILCLKRMTRRVVEWRTRKVVETEWRMRKCTMWRWGRMGQTWQTMPWMRLCTK